MVVRQRPATPAVAARHAPSAWHTTDLDTLLDQFSVSPERGLNAEQIAEMQQRYGLNELEEGESRSPLSILIEQLTNPLVLLLIAAAVISAFLGKADSVIAITAIVILNAVLGVVQEYRAEQAMAALRKLAAPLVRVRRDGKVVDIAGRDLVPGDIVLLEAGSIVPADSRLVEAANLRAQEASLTGESEPVDKDAEAYLKPDAALGDRINMVYMGTSVTYGRGTALVVETGMQTQLGRIARMLQSVAMEKTPLQRRMDELGIVLIRAALAVMVLAFIVGLVTGNPLEEVLLNGVAIAVAVVPEGLPAVVTVALALGAQRMLRRQALIRRLPAVETLGSVTTICSDKTGTLTENRMTAMVVDVAGATEHLEDVISIGMRGLYQMNGSRRTSTLGAEALMLTGSALCTDAIIERNGDEFTTVGDPTETALVMAGARFGLLKPHIEAAFPRVAEVPFDSDRKRMTTIHRYDERPDMTMEEQLVPDLLDLEHHHYISFTKGAVDLLLDQSAHVWVNGSVSPMSEALRQRIDHANERLAQEGLRVLGLAYRRFNALPKRITAETVEHDLIFVGMVGIIDPPRKEVKDAVRVAKMAGIRPVMITGDHPLTAFAIARELGIATEGDRVGTGPELSAMSQEDLENIVENAAVYARVSPEHKLRIVQALQSNGHIAAMTGDGVNDAPALKKADIGVAMGITGTAVSKEASSMVLLDDNFTTIVNAVEEGRTIYDNVRRFIKYLLASNTGELIVLLATQLIAGMTIPLTTLQILWMNLITDGIPALALGVEGSEKGVMTRKPYAANESLFGRGLGRHILLIGTLFGLTGVGLGYWAWSNDLRAANGAPAWNTMVFVFLTIAQMGHALALRSHRETLFRMNLFGNRLLLGAVVFTVVVQMLAVYLPFFNGIFNTNPLTLEQFIICLAVSVVVFCGAELEKWAIRRGWLHG